MSLDTALTLFQVAVVILVCAVVVRGWLRLRAKQRADLAALLDPQPPSTAFDPPDPADYTDVVDHDWACAVGPWPHAGYCAPLPGEMTFRRSVVLAELTNRGKARLRTVREDNTCTGDE